MIKEKISSQEIIDMIASKASVSKRAAEEFLKVMIASVEEGLLAGEIVKIKNFGTFKPQWNEPRKSVNVQTGDEIKIAGYYKVVFVPDTALKEQVNEPFAHLEPVELDVETKKDELVDEPELVSDPLRIFNEQASEIKDLISEIQALSSNPASIISEEENIKKNIIEEEKIHEIVQKDQVLDQPNKGADLTLIEEYESEQPEYLQDSSAEVIETAVKTKLNPSDSKENQLFSELPATPYLENIKSTKKRKVWIWVLLILFLITGFGSGFYYFYTSNYEYPKKYSINEISENISISEMINSISKWFTPAEKPTVVPVKVVIPKDINDYDSISESKPVDSLQILFENPRVYKGFIASERISAGSRLTIMSKRYYGNKDFWVYIYEANKERISNPDNIAIGTLVRIPKLDSRLIDATNPRCLEKAKELHDIYIK